MNITESNESSQGSGESSLSVEQLSAIDVLVQGRSDQETAEAVETVNVQGGSIDYEIGVNLKVLQGKARQLSLGLGGSGELQSVSGEGLVAWSVRRVGIRSDTAPMGPGTSMGTETTTLSQPTRMPTRAQPFPSSPTMEPAALRDPISKRPSGQAPSPLPTSTEMGTWTW